MTLQTERQGSLPWGGGRVSDGHGRAPEPGDGTVRTAQDLPLEDPDPVPFPSLSVPPVPFSPGSLLASSIFILFFPSLALSLPGPQSPGSLKGVKL